MRRGQSRGRASAGVSLGLLFASIVGAGQAFMLVFLVGDGPATDAFLACYSVYVAVALLGVSLRRSVVPLLGAVGEAGAFRLRANELLARISLVAVVAMLLLAAASPLLAGFLTRGLPRDARSTGFLTLVVLAPAVYLQVRAGAISGVLNAVRRFPASVAMYVLSSALALGLSVALLPAIGPLGAAIGLVVGALTLLLGHSVYARRLGLRPRLRLAWLADREQGRLLSFLLPASALGIAQQLNLSLALAALAGAGAGNAITSYAYGYLMVGLMSNLSSYPVALVTLPDAVESVAARGREGGREQIEQTAPFVFVVLAPMLAAYASFGRPFLEVAFGGVLSPHTLDLLYEIGVILEPMVVALSLSTLAGGILLTLGGRRGIAGTAAFSLAIHAAAVFALAPIGPQAVAWGHSGAAIVSALAMIGVAFRGSTAHVAASLARRVAPAFGLALVFPAVGLVAGRLPLWSLALALVGATVLYGVLAVYLWPSVGGRFLRLVPRLGQA